MRKLEILTLLILVLLAPSAVLCQWSKTSSWGADGSGPFVTLGNRLYAGGGDGPMAWTSDDGNTWNAVGNGFPAFDGVFSFAHIGNTLIAGTYYDYIYFSTDSGASWHPSKWNSPGNPNLIPALLAYHTYVFSTGIGRSSDSGRSWEQDTNSLPMWYQQIYSFAENDSIILGGNDAEYVLRSTDGGTTWDTNRITANLYIGDVVDALTIIGNVALAGAGGLFRSTDLGITWSQVDTSQFNYSSGGVTSLLTSGKFVLLGDYNGVFLSRDSGKTWKPFWRGLPAGSLILDLVTHGNYLFAGLQNGGGVYRRPLSDLEGGDYVRLSLAVQQPSGPLEIYDMLGRLIYRGRVEEKPTLPGGLYFERQGGDVRKVWVP